MHLKRTSALTLALMCGCASPDPLPSADVSAAVSPLMGTVVTLSWDDGICPDATATVTLDPDAGEAVGSDEPGQTQLLGLWQDTDYAYTIDLVSDGEPCATYSNTFTTSNVVVGTGDLRTTGDDMDGYFVTSLLTVPSGPMIIDGAGKVVWGRPEPGTTEVVVSRTVLRPDGRSVLYGAYWLYPDDDAEPVNDLVEVAIDGAEISRTKTLNMHHDFVLRPDGVIAYLGAEDRFIDGFADPWRADLLVEIDTDGNQRTVWNAWDDFPWGEDDTVITGAMLDHQEWTHANALQYSEEEDAYYVSVRGRSSIVKIDATTGERLWTLGGNHPDFTLDAGSWFFEEHHFRVEGDDLLLFDNGEPGRLDSRAVRYRLDQDDMTISQTWERAHVPSTYIYVLGDVSNLPNDDTLIVWSTAGELEVVGPDDSTRWLGNLEIGSIFGYVQYLDTLGSTAG